MREIMTGMTKTWGDQQHSNILTVNCLLQQRQNYQFKHSKSYSFRLLILFDLKSKISKLQT